MKARDNLQEYARQDTQSFVMLISKSFIIFPDTLKNPYCKYIN